MKIVCPYCEKVNEVSKGALEVTCEACNQTFSMVEGKKKTVAKYKELQTGAYTALYRFKRFDDAIRYYEEALLIKPNDLSSVIGICLALTSKTSFDHTMFYQVIPTINKYDIYLNLENTVVFLHFISDMFDQIKFYLNESDFRVIKDGTYINKALFIEYIKSLKDILDIFKFFKDSFSLMDEEEAKSFKEENPDFYKRFEELENEVNSRLNKTYNINHIGDIEVSNGELNELKTNKIDLDIDTLDDTSMVVIDKKEVMYMKIFVPSALVSVILGIILFIVYGFTLNIPSLVFAIIFILLGLGLFLFYRFYFNKKK
ncbi:MAG: hypothetical protein IAC58_02785 [Firmicutes bacterium]|uniref:Tetratricopeptide repeat protein n=1 Tax=Candidatus Onthovivens merdipullorum TaxID=2840889 RepID=A0A9D9DIQ4_9BACL|nr:hypothetical protein [Candidatus Onthovivens merdipullorum]